MSKLVNIGLFFAVFGAIFAGIGGWFLWSDHQFAAKGISTQGTIIELASYYDDEGTRMYRPIAEFRDENGELHEFSSKVSSSSPGFSRGDTITVIYDPTDPNEATIDSFGQRYILPIAFTGMGGLFVIIGGWLSLSQVMRARAVARLKQHGVTVEGTVIAINLDTTIAVNDEHPWRVEVEARHPRTGTTNIYKSDHLWDRPYGLKKGDAAPVILSLTNAKKSFVDVEAALEQGRQVERETRASGFGRKLVAD